MKVVGVGSVPGRGLGRFVLVAVVVATPALVQARQHRATFLFVDESGETRQETLTDVRYAYVERRLLDSTRTPHRDRHVRRRALLLQKDRISFNLIRSMEFSYRASESEGVEELVVRATMTDGSERDVWASDLRGFEGVRVPYLEGKMQDGDAVMRFDLVPFRRQDAVSEMPLVRVVFHHGARR